ncbi:MAG: ParB/RepB/Spo0J family partition protein [Desulfovibrio sp.]|nr:ParB/RepB/Spo0J family partition protein [Desulfovibrio sp.]
MVGEIYDVAVKKIRPNPNQPRRSFEAEPLEALKLSIAREGLLQPIACVVDAHGQLIIAAGERRFRAVLDLGWETVPTRIVEGNLEDLAIMENMIREDLNPMERALAMQKYLDQHKISRKKLAVILGMARNSISEILSLNRLPQYIQDVIINDKRYSLHNMRVIARIRNEKEQKAKFEKLRAKIENLEGEDTKKTESKTPFQADVKRDRLTKMTKEVKRLQVSYSKQELKELKPQIRMLYEQLQALLYKIGDELFIEE